MANVLLSASVIIAGVLWVYSVTMEDGQMSNHERTMTFTCFVFFDMFNALSSRSQDRLIFEIGFFSNKCVLPKFPISSACLCSQRQGEFFFIDRLIGLSKLRSRLGAI